MSINKVILVGFVGRDPEIRQTRSGNDVASFSVATTDRWRDKASGERKERTEWHHVVVWDENIVDFVKKYIKKGARVYVEGAQRTRKWVDQKGVERFTTETVVEKFRGVVTSLDRSEGGAGRPQPADDFDDYGSQRSSGPAPNAAAERTALDDEIPF